MKMWAGSVLRLDMSGKRQMCPKVDVADIVQCRICCLCIILLLFLIFSHFHVGSMCLMRRLHLARS